MAKVKDIAMQIRGVSYHPEDLHDNLDEDSVVLLRANNIKDGKLILDDVVYVSKSKVAEQQYLQTGDILICASSGSKELVGKAVFVDLVKNPMTFGAFCKVVRPQPEYSEYLGHYFNSPVYRRKISALSAGANINNIKNEHIDNLDIQLVNEKERREIITILNELNMLISLRKQQLVKLDELVKARFVEMFGDISNSRKVPMQDVCKIITDGTHQPPKFVLSGIPFLFVSNIVTNEIHYDAEKFISEETYNELIKRTPIEVGDVLLSTVGSYGHPAVVKENKPFCFQRHIAYLKPNHSVVNSEYLRCAILSTDLQRQIDESVKGIAQKTLNLSEIRKLRLPLPSLSLQNQFAAFVERIDQQKQTVQQSLEKLELMKKALMQEYFG